MLNEQDIKFDAKINKWTLHAMHRKHGPIRFQSMYKHRLLDLLPEIQQSDEYDIHTKLVVVEEPDEH